MVVFVECGQFKLFELLSSIEFSFHHRLTPAVLLVHVMSQLIACHNLSCHNTVRQLHEKYGEMYIFIIRFEFVATLARAEYDAVGDQISKFVNLVAACPSRQAYNDIREEDWTMASDSFGAIEELIAIARTKASLDGDWKCTLQDEDENNEPFFMASGVSSPKGEKVVDATIEELHGEYIVHER